VSRLPIAVAAWGKAAEWLTLAAMLTVIPRVLGPSDYGSFGLALGLVTLGSAAFALGGPTVMARFVAAARPEERAGLARALALSAIRWRTTALALLTGFVVALVLFAPHRFPPRHTLIVLAAVVLDAAATLAFQIALGLDRAVLWSFRYPVQNLIVVAAVPPLHAAAGATGALIAIALSAAAALLLGAWAIRGHLVGPRARVPAEASRFAVLQAMNGLFVQVLHRGGVVAVALLAGSRVETGYATIALGVAIAFTYAVWQVFTVALPPLAEVAATDVHAAGAQLTRLAGRVVIVLVPATVAAAALAGPMLKVLAGGRFAPAKDALAGALAMVPLAPITGAVGAAAAIRLRPGARLWTTAAGAAIFVAVAVVLVPSLRAAGASTALLAGTVVSALGGTVLFPDLLDRRLVAAALAASMLVLLIGVDW
jgi:O-antigen/teichoic acid export membrane protein